MRKLTTHPQLKNLLPPLSESQRQGLEADILKHGCLTPIVVWNNIIVDGHARYAVCEKYRLPFETVKLKFDTLDDAMFWAWTHQDNRRNLTPYQRSEIALQFKSILTMKAKEKERIRKSTEQDLIEPLPEINTRNEIAKMAGVSHETVRKAEYIHDHADDETKQRLRSGQTTINREYTQLKEATAPMLSQPVSVPKQKLTPFQISPKNTQELIETIAGRFGVVDLERLIFGLVEHLYRIRYGASFDFFIKKLVKKYRQQ